MKKAYFLISVSNKRHLDLCVKYALAGFTSSISGVWTFEEVQMGDFVSFLYGAKAHNLYIVKGKEAIKKPGIVEPWEVITFKQSGKSYYFPFRLHLSPVRKLEESLVRAEFAYVAENLLLRGGYRRTHFQADQTTLQAVSQMGGLWDGKIEQLSLANYPTFVPRFTKQKEKAAIPEVFRFHEFILQALVRQYLRDGKNLGNFLPAIGVKDISPEALEVLGEKAFPEGNVDILMKEATPMGTARKIIIEVKTGVAQRQHLAQLRGYAEEIGDECVAAVLVARNFSPAMARMAKDMHIGLVSHSFIQSGALDGPFTFDELLGDFSLESTV